MTDGPPTVPESSFNHSPTSTGRARSGSTRSNRSGESGPSIDRAVADYSGYSRRPTIRIRRFPSNQVVTQHDDNGASEENNDGHISIEENEQHVGRHRALSAPLRLQLPGSGSGIGSSRQPPRRPSVMPDVAEETFSPTIGSPRDDIRPISRDFGNEGAPEAPVDVDEPEPSRSARRPLRRARTNIGTDRRGRHQGEYETELVDLLDLVGKLSSIKELGANSHFRKIPRLPL
jgi:hypothetical protein